jgi:hypothetical protein
VHEPQASEQNNGIECIQSEQTTHIYPNGAESACLPESTGFEVFSFLMA